MNSVEYTLKNIIINNSKKEISENEIDKNSNLIVDFGFDSIQIITMIVDIEEEFDILIEDEDIKIDILTNYGLLKELLLKKIKL